MEPFHIFAQVPEPLYDAVHRAAMLSRISKRALISAMIAEKAGIDDPAIHAARAAWARYRKERDRG